MRFLFFLVLLTAAAPAFPQVQTEKRLNGLDKRVTKVEKRVTKLESGDGAAAAPGAEKRPANPVAVYFLSKKQIVGQDKIGIRLYVEFENLTNHRLEAFNGTLVFRDEKGALIWSKAYAHSEQLGAGEKVEVSLGVLSDKAKIYLHFVKAAKIMVTLEKQEAYGTE